MNSAKYARGADGLPTPVSGGVKSIASGILKKPAAGKVILERVVKRRASGIVAPTEEADAAFASYRIVAKGSDCYVPRGCGAALPFDFEVGAEVILAPTIIRADGAVVSAPMICKETPDGLAAGGNENREIDAEGRPTRILADMADVWCEVEPTPRPVSDFDA